jgi:uncharacterized membrane protein YedE/YeeE
MIDALSHQAPWYAIGPLFGLVLVSLLALANVRMGVLGGWSDVIERALGRVPAVGWKGWFVIGIVLGGLLFRVLAGASSAAGTGALEAVLGSTTGIGIFLALVVAGGLVGYGAKWAGGCTSGNGLSGASFGSPAGIVAMLTFMATAIGATLVLGALS